MFAAASDAFSLKNINCTVMDSFERFKPVMAAAKSAGVKVRGYAGSMCVGFSGSISHVPCSILATPHCADMYPVFWDVHTQGM